MTRMSKGNGSYEVGYGKPPEHTRFKPGQCGNPRGRPRKEQNFATDLQAALSEKVSVTENGKKRRLTKRELMMIGALNKAIKGDMRALTTVVGLMARLGLIASLPAPDVSEDSPDDRAILEMFLASQYPNSAASEEG